MEQNNLPADHLLKALNTDECHDLHHSTKKIGEDFVLEKGHDGEWLLRIKVGEHSCYCGADQWLIAMWKSREAMYALFKKIYAAATIEDVRQIIATSRLDMGRIIPQGDGDVEKKLDVVVPAVS